ncbi:hypothetical protein J3B02_000473 [Coemansia erecta]|uniref:Myb-like domain-containing protein n=1 Tax=Coemansia asiatica TaxID=1052880 RepID=A0A9W7XPG0_9FUNG|nr:hypothetical protein LPJ64_001706 [Coemansia asiatica]KAJ2858133.1 hypothetical protein J3B02_000473 [Coemansia erecta]KAJ2879565.1 hypothetical protein FB639_003059 [Coemansia asiatica]
MTRTETISEYERERLENIRQNQEMLKSLNLASEPVIQATKVVHKGRAKPRATRRGKENKQSNDSDKEKADDSDASNSNNNNDEDNDDDSDYGSSGKTKRRTKIAVATRRSKRLRGESALEGITEIEKEAVETGDFSGLLQTGEERFGQTADTIKVSGHYGGWVEPGVMERLGIRSNATEAWESEGGGKFSFKDPLGTGKKISKKMAGGQSVAKYVASKLLRKNPNSYFYRHTEPGVEQWTGDWTDEERLVFLDIARRFGCGDKWGLFSTYIPHRVGYQCSNYYRQYVIPAGWIIDDNYRIDSAGNAVYVGNHRRSAR